MFVNIAYFCSNSDVKRQTFAFLLDIFYHFKSCTIVKRFLHLATLNALVETKEIISYLDLFHYVQVEFIKPNKMERD